MAATLSADQYLGAPRIVFPQALRAAYKRVNKTGSFNTRCFPAHSSTGHSDCTFCGRPFVVIAVGLPADTEFFAEFATKKSPAKSSPAQFSREGYRGEQLANEVVVFNQACTAWKYAWKSSRHTFDTLHVMRVYAFSPATGALALVQDSTPFTVSSTRNVALDKHQTDVAVMLAAMGRLVPSSHTLASVMDFDFDDVSSVLDLGDLSTEFPALSDAEEERCMAQEQLGGALERLHAFMLTHYSSWRCAADMRVGVQTYLRAHESTSIEQLAALASRVVNTAAPVASVDMEIEPTSLLNFTHAHALMLAQSFLSDGEFLVEGVELGGCNDPSGCYLRDPEFSKLMGQMGEDMGWSPVDQDLHARVQKTLVAAMSPTQVLFAYVGPATWSSDVYEIGVANVPCDKRPTLFGAAMEKRIAYMFATNKAVMHVAKGADFGGNVFLGKFSPHKEAKHVHVQIRTPGPAVKGGGEVRVLKNAHYEFKRVML